MYIWEHAEWPQLRWDAASLDMGWLESVGQRLEDSDGLIDDSNQRHPSELRTGHPSWTTNTLLEFYQSLGVEGGGSWRDDQQGPMLVTSGSLTTQVVHYQAPPADRIISEIEALLTWLNANRTEPPLVQAAIAFLWFVAIHPFSDGNGRMARMVTDRTFSLAQGSSGSLCARLRLDRKDYYHHIERALKGGPDITGWLEWFGRRAHKALEPG